MPKITPPNVEEIREELAGGPDTILELSPASFYILMVVLKAGNAAVKLDRKNQASFDQWLTETEATFAALFPKAGEFIKGLDVTLQKKQKPHSN